MVVVRVALVRISFQAIKNYFVVLIVVDANYF